VAITESVNSLLGETGVGSFAFDLSVDAGDSTGPRPVWGWTDEGAINATRLMVRRTTTKDTGTTNAAFDRCHFPTMKSTCQLTGLTPNRCY